MCQTVKEIWDTLLITHQGNNSSFIALIVGYFDYGIDKSPGPDGFTFVFYRHFWKIVKNDVTDAVKYFFQHGCFPRGSNYSFIALIPKVSDAKMVKDFRPISLLGSLYQIIAKLLANHLVHVLGDIVNEVQYAFVANRQILDGPFILNELLQWCKSKKKQSLIFKVDFEKAYDSVQWDFLDDVLKKFGFSAKWCGWIQSCLRSSRCLIMVNGSSLVLSHMFYADDAVFMGQWSDSNIDIIVHVLECFYRASGMHINMKKKVIKAIHGNDGKIGKKTKSAHPSIWLDIVHEMDFLEKQEDVWCGDSAFNQMYPRIYALETCKHVNVASKLQQTSLDFSFRRGPRGGVEQEQFADLVAKVEGILLVNMKDR
ncbi:RNA-directed DNA polymerase, eukaryota [Tanacetum coccineum]